MFIQPEEWLRIELKLVNRALADNAARNKPEYLVLSEMTNADLDLAIQDSDSPETMPHYCIYPSGDITQLARETYPLDYNQRLKWDGRSDLGYKSIGITFIRDNRNDEIAEKQFESGTSLMRYLQCKYGINSRGVISLSDATFEYNQEQNPGHPFPWLEFAREGFGMFLDCSIDPKKPDQALLDFKSSGPEVEELRRNLIRIGFTVNPQGPYDKKLDHAVRHFNLRFNPNYKNSTKQQPSNNAEFRQSTKFILGQMSSEILYDKSAEMDNNLFNTTRTLFYKRDEIGYCVPGPLEQRIQCPANNNDLDIATNFLQFILFSFAIYYLLKLLRKCRPGTSPGNTRGFNQLAEETVAMPHSI